MKNEAGFSVVEVMLAAGLFTIFVTGMVSVVLQGLNANRAAGEQVVAAALATEGLEAAKSIRNQSYASLVNSSGTGVAISGGVWGFSGLSNTFDKYTRILTISDVLRDGSGDIVVGSGTLDPNTKKIVSTVTWSVNSTRVDSAALTAYLTNWRASIAAAGGLVTYGDGTTTPKYRTYDTSANTFTVATPTVTSSSGRTFIFRTSPTKQEAIAGFVTSAGVLNIQCFNGSSWTQEWTVTVGGNAATRRFDIAYETNSGDVMVFYSSDISSLNEMAYRTKAGNSGCGTANWAAATNFDPVRTSGTVQWVKMAWDKRAGSNLLTAIWADSNSDLSAAVWSGTAWGNEPAAATETSLEVVSTSQDVEDFDVEYESISGDVMVVWANSIGARFINGVRYRTCTGGTSTCTWNAVTTPPTFADDATSLDISANPNSNEIVFASVGNATNNMQAGYWSGSAWTDDVLDTSCNVPGAGEKLVATGWLVFGATARSFIVYADQGSRGLDWFTGNAGSFTKQVDWRQSPEPTDPTYFDVQMNPLSKEQAIYLVSDINKTLLAKRIVMDASGNFTWTNSDGTNLSTTLPQASNSPFSFAFWRN